MTRFSALLSIGFSLGLTVACSSSDGGGDKTNAEACADVIEACHTKDDGTGMVNSCHENAHNGGECLGNLQECVDACNAAPDVGGHDTDHGTGGHTGTGGHGSSGGHGSTGGHDTEHGSTGGHDTDHGSTSHGSGSTGG